METKNLLDHNGHLTEEGVYLYTDALMLGMTEALPEEVLEHVQECLKCKHLIRETYELVKEQDYQTLRPHPYFDQKKTRPFFKFSTITRIAAAVVIGVGLAFLAYFYLPEAEHQVAVEDRIEDPMEVTPEEFVPVPPDITEPEEVPVQPEIRDPMELYAANFEPSPFYENLAGQPFRSHAVRVLTPELNQEFKDTVNFSWESRVPISVHLQILDNRENVIWSTSTDEKSVKFAGNLEPGIYYWRLETEEELLYVGKFYILIP